MTTTRQLDPSNRVDSAQDAPARLWGLSATQIHEAFWFARGVQCVRRGESGPLQRAAELYLLIEPDQLVLFDIRPLSERLVWRNAKATRLRLIDAHAEPYHERVISDDEGYVQRIERRYAPTLYGSYRVILTPSRRLASYWNTATDRRVVWDRIRRAVAWSRVDHCRAEGRAFREGDPKQERLFLDELVNRWPRPDQVIDGIHQAADGVWCLDGDTIDENDVCIGPLWLGSGQTKTERPCLIGPHWLEDVDVGPVKVATLREILDVEPDDTQLAAAARRTGTYRPIKRAMDITISLAALIVFLPLMALIGAAIVATEGRPIFFGQMREGRGGINFRCWKFRTMYLNAEEIARQYQHVNKCDGPQIFIEDDPRVTRIGKLLRTTHLDELPQLWNVLTGQMSIVGPRPSPARENQFCPAWRDARLSVRPGITGMWQLLRKRRAGEDFQEWIKYDLDYVQRASLRVDLIIMVRTAWMILRGREDGAS